MTQAQLESAIAGVREAQSEVTALLAESGFTSDQREVLDELSDSLRDLEACLVLADLKERAARLDACSTKAKDACDEAKQSIAKVERAVKRIDQVAKAVDKAVKVVKVVA